MRKISDLVRQRAEVIAEYKREKRTVRRGCKRLANAERGRDVIQQIAESVQNRAHANISGLVSRCIAMVFDNPYEFQMVFERKRGKTEARPIFMRDGHEHDPKEMSGIGVMDVAAFALRLSAVLLARPRRRLFEIMDEPFKFVSVEYRPRVVELLMTLARELGFQFIIVTHDREFAVGKLERIK